MAIGNLHNNRERLKAELSKIKYRSPIDTRELPEGHPAAIFPVIHFLFLEYSDLVSNYISDMGYDLATKNDAGFLESIYKLLRNKFNYVPILRVDQFLSLNYAERKILIVLDIVKLVKQKHKELLRFQQRPRRVGSMTSQESEELQQKLAEKQAIEIPSENLNFQEEIIVEEKVEEDAMQTMKRSETESQLNLASESPYHNEIEDSSIMIRTAIEFINALTMRISKIESKVEIFIEETDAKIHLIHGKIKSLEQRRKSNLVQKAVKRYEDHIQPPSSQGLLGRLGLSQEFFDKPRTFF
ncbi:CEP44_2 [Blepharisma stoltei]|uniref:Centrosomal protein of 44 kDa n=1 Tax=Blepharisma stoltei TaxID=1481888 RepID=A0AAU9JDN8_9CILI|nr:unnamed protein product [Blepharisma stoltei]